MAVTKREVAERLGVSKQTVVNYINRLGLAPEHVTRKGKFDLLDDYAVSVIADAIGKGFPDRSQPKDDSFASSDAVLSALQDRIDDLKAQNDALRSELDDLRASRDAEVSSLRMQLHEANERASRLAERVTSIAERQQVIAATPWWRRGKLAMKLLGPGSDR